MPGFTICGSLIRLWVFDRSGLYNSEKFDVYIELERFIRGLARYVDDRSGVMVSYVY